MVAQTVVPLGEHFIAALEVQDFDRLETLFAPQVRFRALVPPRVCEAQSPGDAIGWLHRWFGSADEIQVLHATAEQVFDRLHLHYRLRVHDAVNGWRVIEQHAYGDVRDDRIADMWLLCSGFRPAAADRALTALDDLSAPDFIP